MQYRRIITVCGFVFSLVLCAFALGGCVLWDALFPEELPPRLIIRNESFGDIASIEFWESTPEIEESAGAVFKAYLLMLLSVSDPWEFLLNTAAFLAAYAEYEEATSALTQTPPLLKDTAAIPYDGSRSYDIDMDKGYAVRVDGVNGKKLAFARPDRTKDTVYVFNGEQLIKKE
jgi:hypothetical protein